MSLTMGISEKDFWNINPRKLKPYIKARDFRMDDQNFFCWMQGRYFLDAIQCVVSALSDDDYEYPSEPYRLHPMTKEEKEEAVEIERKKAIAYFNSMIK